LRQPVGPLLWVACAGVLALLATAAAVALIRRPRAPDTGPGTMELRPESPAVAGMLTHRFEVTRDATAATLLDLAARGSVEIDQLGDETFVTAKAADPALLRHEELVLAHVRSLGGVRVPAAALTTGPQDRSSRWWRRFRKAVIADARRRALCQPVWDREVVGGLAGAFVVCGFVFWASVRFDLDSVETTPLFVVTLVALIVAGAVVAGIVASDRQRDTALGRQAAAHWLGFRQHHEDNDVVATLPPAAVTVRGRYLAYCAALGLAAAAVRALPLGAEDNRRAWTDYGGRWRQVRVRYPHLRPGWGRRPWVAIAAGCAGSFASFNLFRVAGWFRGDFDPVANVITVAGVLVLAWFGSELLLAAVDVVTPDRTVVGEVVRQRELPGLAGGGNRNESNRKFVALDTGEGDRVDAWSVSREIYDLCPQGREVQVTLTWPLQHVRRVEPASLAS
jgi:hypothetical protein